MKREDHATANPNQNGSGKSGFKTSAPFTVWSPTTANQWQEELATMLEGFGVTLNSAQTDQIYRCMRDDNRRAVTDADASQPIFGCTADSQDHPSSGANRWKLILRAPAADGTFVRLYAGDGTNGNFCLTTNALWAPASGSQTWSRDNNAQEANRLLCTDGTLSWHGKAAAGTAWADGAWDLARGVMAVGDGLSVGGDALIGGTLGAGDIETTGSVISSGGFLYPAPITTSRGVPLSTFQGNGNLTTFGQDLSIPIAGIAVFPLVVPAGATSAIVRIKIAAGAAYTITTRKLAAPNFSTTATPAFTTIDTETGSAPGAVTNLSLDLTGTINPVECWQLAVSNDDGAATLGVKAIQLTWSDNGPQ